MAKTASLSSSLVAKKGQAAPVGAAPVIAQAPLQLPTPAVDQPASPATHAEAAVAPLRARPAVAASPYKALTIKLDERRYKTLKQLGLKLDKTSQSLMVEAFDQYIAAMSAKA